MKMSEETCISKNERVSDCKGLKLEYIGLLRPTAQPCKTHKKCFLKIKHDDSCQNPYFCSGSLKCTVDCEKNLTSEIHNYSRGVNFWKSISFQVCKANLCTRDVSTMAVSYKNNVETFVDHEPDSETNLRSFALNDCTSDLVTRFDNLDFNSRKHECKKRLQQKLQEKTGRKSVSINSSDVYGYIVRLSKESVVIPQCPTEKEKIKTKPEKRQKCKSGPKAEDLQPLEQTLIPSDTVYEEEQKQIKDKEYVEEVGPINYNNSVKSVREMKETEEVGSNKLNVDDEIAKILSMFEICEPKTPRDKQKITNKKMVNQGTQTDIVKQPTLYENKKKYDNFDLDKLTLFSDNERCLTAESGLKENFEICVFCKEEEKVRNTFSKCTMCVRMNLPDRFYCSFGCFETDWVQFHGEVHKLETASDSPYFQYKI